MDGNANGEVLDIPPTALNRNSPSQKCENRSGKCKLRCVMISKANRLQRFWRETRNLSTKNLAQAFRQQGPSIEKLTAMNFPDVVALLRQKGVIRITKDFLQRIHIRTNFLRKEPTVANAELVNVRVFLAAFMIVCYPFKVFETMGALESDLLNSATILVESCEAICLALQEQSPRAFVECLNALPASFSTLLLDYFHSFKAWKIPDEARLCARIRHALIALYTARHQLPLDEPEDSPLKTEFRAQLERLRSKLVRIAGPDALARFDAERNAEPVLESVTGVVATPA